MDIFSAYRVAGQAASLPALPDAAARVPRQIPAPELERLPLAPPAAAPARSEAVPVTFEGVLNHTLEDVNHRQLAAQDKVRGLLSGQDVSLHETMISLEEASVSFQLMVEVRNKLLESYQELMRMQV